MRKFLLVLGLCISLFPLSACSKAEIAGGSKYIPSDNIIVSKINQRIETLRLPVQEVVDNFEIVTEGSVPEDALNSIKLQHQYMLQAFPNAFKWGTNKFFIFENVAWAKDKATELNCYIPETLLRPEDIPSTMWSSATHCGSPRTGKDVISLLNWLSFVKYDPSPIRQVTGADMWEFLTAQEGDGSVIQTFYYKGKDKYGPGNPLPAWFEQGGQFALSSIALAVQSRQWRQSSLMQGVVQTCNLKKVEESSFYNANPNLGGCHYQLGAMATELMIALYGFDAPTKWFENFEILPNSPQNVYLDAWQSTFKTSYGDDISTFYRWANAYVRYLDSKGEIKLPKDLLEALKNR